jgi:hypothetical protein
LLSEKVFVHVLGDGKNQGLYRFDLPLNVVKIVVQRFALVEHAFTSRRAADQ